MRPVALLALGAVPVALRAQSTDTLLSALRLPSRAGFAPLVPPPPGRPVLLRPDRVFDATSEETHAGWVVLVEGDSIAAVGPASAVRAPNNVETIALPGLTLPPAFTAPHSHLFLHPYNETLWNDQVLKEPEGYRMVEAVLHARNTLLQGFTTLRDLGPEGAGFEDVSIKRAIDEGLIPGPRLAVATRPSVATARYGARARGMKQGIRRWRPGGGGRGRPHLQSGRARRPGVRGPLRRPARLRPCHHA